MLKLNVSLRQGAVKTDPPLIKAAAVVKISDKAEACIASVNQFFGDMICTVLVFH
ncbi:hypothetical protein D3C73_1018830 [compost metagenome]